VGEIRTYRYLRVWTEAMTLAENCYLFSHGSPREELFDAAEALLSHCAEMLRGLIRNVQMAGEV
jgi:hypothetical protein